VVVVTPGVALTGTVLFGLLLGLSFLLHVLKRGEEEQQRKRDKKAHRIREKKDKEEAEKAQNLEELVKFVEAFGIGVSMNSTDSLRLEALMKKAGTPWGGREALSKPVYEALEKYMLRINLDITEKFVFWTWLSSVTPEECQSQAQNLPTYDDVEPYLSGFYKLALKKYPAGTPETERADEIFRLMMYEYDLAAVASAKSRNGGHEEEEKEQEEEEEEKKEPEEEKVARSLGYFSPEKKVQREEKKEKKALEKMKKMKEKEKDK
jgi:beta-phosphoglucomutase-like phosphatase (HAD superfamily)